MATPRITRPTRTNRPTRNSDHVSCLLRAIQRFLRKVPANPALNYTRLNQKSSQIRILSVQHFFRAAFKVNTPLAQNQKAGDRLPVGGGGCAPADSAGLRIEVEIG